jgi:mono/diheme cytochrome c family protein
VNLRHLMTRHWTALLLSAGVIAPGWADDSAHISASTGLGNAGGSEIYTHICQGCHMPNGEGATGAGHYPKLAGDNALGSWEYAVLMVLNGRGAMPAFGLEARGLGANPATPFYVPHLSDSQVAEVVNYVRSHFGNHYKAKVTGVQVAKLPHPKG